MKEFIVQVEVIIKAPTEGLAVSNIKSLLSARPRLIAGYEVGKVLPVEEG